MIKIGRVDVSLELRQLFVEGHPQRIGSRAFDILEVLINAGGKLVSKVELFQSVWPKTVVEENNLQVHISVLRKLLGDDKDLIKTIPGRGYRLIHSRNPDDPILKHADEPARAEKDLTPSNLPVRCAPLIGREKALDDVQRALETAPLVTLVGTGGIGKTQLGLEVARAQAACFDNVRYINLSLVERSGSVLSAIADGLALERTTAGITQATLADSIGSRKLLMVLDNCEHVIHEAADVCEQLVLANPNLKILATSREPLRVSFEKLYWVLPLDAPHEDAGRDQILACSAARMFVSRVCARDPQFQADDDSFKLIGTICRRLDGVPLALELAAARVNELGIWELVAQLDNRFVVLTRGLRTAPARQQTLKATLDWSYQFLCNAERTVLRRLSVFRGSFQLGAACEVVARADLSTEEVTEAIAGLVSKSLLMFGPRGSCMTYYLLETTRSYALEMLADTGESELTIRKHERYLRTLDANQSASAADLYRPEALFQTSLDASSAYCGGLHREVAG
jgi:predicted ATPase/DNA-binding winged helix-turn-helix (wHTH) protein